jgi:hypothetical protein
MPLVILEKRRYLYIYDFSSVFVVYTAAKAFWSDFTVGNDG